MISELKRFKRARVLVGAMVIGALLVACGGSDDDGASDGGGSDTEEVSAQEWAGEVCSQFSSWLQRVQARGESLAEQLQAAGGDPQAVRTELISLLDGFVRTTDDLINNVQEAGTPNIEDGAQIKENFENGLERIKTAFEDAKANVESLPTDNGAAFQQGAGEIQADLQQVSQDLQSEFSELAEQYPQVNQAFQGAQECSEVRS